MTVEGVEEQARDSRGDGGSKTKVGHTGKREGSTKAVVERNRGKAEKRMQLK